MTDRIDKSPMYNVKTVDYCAYCNSSMQVYASSDIHDCPMCQRLMQRLDLNEPLKKEAVNEKVPDGRSTATLDLKKLSRPELIDLIHLLMKDRHDFK